MPKSHLFASAIARPAGASLACLALSVAVWGTSPALAATSTTPVDTPPNGLSSDDAPYGWSWLRQALDTLRPSADTRLPETTTQAVQRLEDQINRGDAANALAEIERRLAERRSSAISGTDVRLVFLRARALTALGRLPEATAAYRQMTVDYPELPEPWNNLAVVLVAQGQLDQAHDALTMALRTHPDYAAAQANLADLLVLQAQRAYARAAELGNSAASRQLQLLQPVVAGTQP